MAMVAVTVVAAAAAKTMTVIAAERARTLAMAATNALTHVRPPA